MGTDSKQRRARRRCHTGSYRFSAQPAAASWDSGAYGLASARSYQFERSPPTPDAATTTGQWSASRRVDPSRHRSQPTNFYWQPSENHQDHQPERRNDEFDADAVPFLPQFLFQELIFAHPIEEISSTNPTGSLSQRNHRHRVRHLADPDHSQLLIAWCWQMDLFRDVECTSHLFATVTFTSANTALVSSTLAAFWPRKQQQQLSYVGSGQTVGSGHTGATSTNASTAYTGLPSMNERDIILEAVAELPDLDDSPPTTRWPGPSDTDNQQPTTQPIAALRDGTNCPRSLHCVTSGVRVSRNKMLFPSFPHAIILSVCCTASQTFTVVRPALFLSRFCVLTQTHSTAAAHDTRTDCWADTLSDILRKTGLRSRGKSHASGRLSKEEPGSGNDTPALSTRLTKNAKDEEARSVPSERICDSTEHDQAGVMDGREILAAPADVCRDQICSHPNTELCDGLSLAAAVALHSRQIIGSSFNGFSTVSSTPLSRPESEVDGPFPDRRSGTITGPHSIHLPGHARPQQKLLC